jgi:hypothetical protein
MQQERSIARMALLSRSNAGQGFAYQYLHLLPQLSKFFE